MNDLAQLLDFSTPHGGISAAQWDGLPIGPTTGLGVSVCIPAYNEADILPETVEEAARVLESMPGEHEILIVDDGSEDETWETLSHLANVFPQLRPLRHEENRGLVAAQRTLVNAAAGRYIFHIGADRQWRMAEIPRMLGMIEQGYDIVIGVRRKKQYTMWRRLVSGTFNLCVALLWGKHFGDLGSLKLVRSSLWKQVPFDASSAFIHAQRLLVAWRNGARVAAIPVDHLPRATGLSKFNHPAAAVRAMAEMLRFRFSPRSRYRLPRNWRREERERTGP